LLVPATMGSGFLLSAWSVLAVACLASFLSRASVHFLSGKPRLKLSRDLGSGKRLFLAVWVLEVEPLHSVGVRFFGGLIGLLDGDLATLNRAPPNLDADTRFLGVEGGDVLSGHDRVFLAWTWVVGCHPPDGHLRIREDGDCSERVVPGCCYLESSRNRCALCVVCQPILVLWPFQVVHLFQVTA